MPFTNGASHLAQVALTAIHNGCMRMLPYYSPLKLMRELLKPIVNLIIKTHYQKPLLL
jgi:hypothetical protein